MFDELSPGCQTWVAGGGNEGVGLAEVKRPEAIITNMELIRGTAFLASDHLSQALVYLLPSILHGNAQRKASDNGWACWHPKYQQEAQTIRRGLWAGTGPEDQIAAWD